MARYRRNNANSQPQKGRFKYQPDQPNVSNGPSVTSTWPVFNTRILPIKIIPNTFLFGNAQVDIKSSTGRMYGQAQAYIRGTRFYFTSTGTPNISPAYDAEWDKTSEAVRHHLEPQKTNTPLTNFTCSEAVTTNPYDVAVGQFISPPLNGAQTINGAIKGIIQVLESNGAADFQAQTIIRVVSNDGSTVRGTLIAADTSVLSNEFGTASANRKFPKAWAGEGTTPSSVNAQDGDRIVVEIGIRSLNTVATNRVATFAFGDPTSTPSDALQNETDTASAVPWIEFGGVLYFQSISTRVSQDVTQTLILPNDAVARISQDVTQVLVLPNDAVARVSQTVYQVLWLADAVAATNYLEAQANADIKTTGYLFGQAQADVKSKGFLEAQSQADIKHTYYLEAQAQAWITGHSFLESQAQADIKATNFLLAQAQADIKKTNFLVAQANANIAKTSYLEAQAQSRIIGHPYLFVQAQADIKTRGYLFSQAQSDIKHTYYLSAQSQSDIKSTGYLLAQANADIKQTYPLCVAGGFDSGGFDEAGFDMGCWGMFAQAQADIKSNNKLFAQAQADIKKTGFLFAQAQANIGATNYKHAQAQADIKATGYLFGQAQSDIKKIGYLWAQSQADIKKLSFLFAQAQGYIVRTSYLEAQAQGDIKAKGSLFAQAQATIKKSGILSAQAQAYVIGKFLVGQAQAVIFVSAIIQPPVYPSARYLVKYNGYVLPGYSQGEGTDSLETVGDHQADYADMSLSEYMGLENKSYSILMKVWKQDYSTARSEVQKAATYLRSNREDFVPLYIQYTDRHYNALVKTIKSEKSVGTTWNIREYSVDFELKPWLESDTSHTIQGTTGVITTDLVSRTLDNGTWSPVNMILSGTDITISGYTADRFTGFISIAGAVSNIYVDSEHYTATVVGSGGSSSNAVDKITWADFAMYVGPGKTTFVVTGATSSEFTYVDRWLI